MIKLEKNAAAIDAVNRANFQGKSIEERKPLYLEANVFNDADLDGSIYRIVPLRYFLNDIKSGVLTHTQVGKKMWKDSYENPLTRRQFIDRVTGETYDLKAILESKFGVCWTTDPEDSLDNWDQFADGRPAVRLRTTPRKLMSAVMSLNNPFFMLNHFIGKIQYWTASEVDNYTKRPDVEDYLDSLGHELAFSVMNLLHDHADEKEVRLVYSHSPNGNSWVAENVQVEDGLCKVPFEWNGVLDCVEVGPEINDDRKADLSATLQALGYNIPVSRSSVRR